MVEGENIPVYGSTLEDIGLYKTQTKLPFNALEPLPWQGRIDKMSPPELVEEFEAALVAIRDNMSSL